MHDPGVAGAEVEGDDHLVLGKFGRNDEVPVDVVAVRRHLEGLAHRENQIRLRTTTARHVLDDIAQIVRRDPRAQPADGGEPIVDSAPVDDPVGGGDHERLRCHPRTETQGQITGAVQNDGKLDAEVVDELRALPPTDVGIRQHTVERHATRLTCRRHPNNATYTRSPIRIGQLFFLYVDAPLSPSHEPHRALRVKQPPVTIAQAARGYRPDEPDTSLTPAILSERAILDTRMEIAPPTLNRPGRRTRDRRKGW